MRVLFFQGAGPHPQNVFDREDSHREYFKRPQVGRVGSGKTGDSFRDDRDDVEDDEGDDKYIESPAERIIL